MRPARAILAPVLTAIRSPVTAAILAAVLTAGLAAGTAPPSEARACKRPQLQGVWVNPDRAPGDIAAVEIVYNCYYDNFRMRSVTLSESRRPVRTTFATARPIGEQPSKSLPSKIGAMWEPHQGCERRTTDTRFWHLIATLRVGGISVLHRGKYCDGSPFVRVYDMVRE